MRSLEKTPVWYQPDAVLGSAVRYVAGLSPKFNWTGIYVLKGGKLELGPHLGATPDRKRAPIETKSELVVLVRDKKGKILGQIDIDSHVVNAFGPAEEKAVQQVADELGQLWHA